MNIDFFGLLAPILQIIWIDIVLSGDNAVVIGLACRALPERQRYLGITFGTGAAVLLRILLTILVVEVLKLPYIRLVGALLLFWIAIRLALNERGEKNLAPAHSVFSAVRIIVIADTVMSLDNVMAIAAAAKGSIMLVAFGLALSVPFIIFGATLFLALFSKYPVLVFAGAAVLGYVGGQLLSTEPALAILPLAQTAHWEIGGGIGGAVLVLAAALLLRRFTEPKPEG